MRIIPKENIRDIVSPTHGQSLPRKSPVVAAHHQAVAARGPTRVFVRKTNSDKLRTRSDAGRQPQLPTVRGAEDDTVVAANPSMLLIAKVNGKQILGHGDVHGHPGPAAILTVNNAPTVPQIHPPFRTS